VLAEKQAPFRTSDLTRENQAALRKHNWPKNLAELRQLAADLVAHAATGNLRDASKGAGRSHASLARDFRRAGLEFPLFRKG
jgi:DNA-binding NtrC family response regulator